VFFPVSYAAHLQDLRKTIQDDASDSEDEIEIPGAWDGIDLGSIA
jgi:hypothetical protein